MYVWTLSGDSAQCVLNFSGQKAVRDESTIISAHYDNSLGQGYIVHNNEGCIIELADGYWPITNTNFYCYYYH